MRFKKPIVKLPKDMDEECVSLCKTLNLLPGIYTQESCCGFLDSGISIRLLMPYPVFPTREALCEHYRKIFEL